MATRTDPRQLAWRALMEVHGTLVPRLAEELRAEHGLAMLAYDVLLRLFEAPGERLRMTELARAVIISKSGLTSAVDRLEADGLVRREIPPHDRRAIDVVLTAAGRERFASARRFHRAGIERHFCASLSEDEGRAVAAALARVLEAADRGA